MQAEERTLDEAFGAVAEVIISDCFRRL